MLLKKFKFWLNRKTTKPSDSIQIVKIDQTDACIESIMNGDERSYSSLFKAFAQDDDEIKLKAARFLAKQKSDLDYFSIIRIDQQMRQTTSVEWFIDWHLIPIEQFFSKEMTEDERCAVLVFASFHSNGYVREAATQAISHYQGALPYIVLRLNDWASAVRNAAKISFKHRVEHLVFGELSKALPFLMKLEKGMRDNHQTEVDTLCSILMSPEYVRELNTILESQDYLARKICVRTLCRDLQHNIEILKKHVLKETEPFLRLYILENLLLVEKNWDSDFLELLAKDKYAKIRIFSLKVMRKTESQCVRFEPYLLNRDAHVRLLARQIIGSINASYDFQSFYLQCFNSTQQATAITGFAEVSQKKDCMALEPYLETKEVRTLCALIKALMSLNFEHYEYKMVEYLNDSRHRVVKEVFHVFYLKKYHSVTPRIREIFLSSNDSYVRYKCALLLFKISGWEKLIYIIEALLVDDEKVHSLALRKFFQWEHNFGRSFFVTPTEDQIIFINKLLENNKNTLSEHLLNRCTGFLELYIKPKESIS